MGSSGLEPPTSRLSGARSNLLSYEPAAAVPQPYSHIFQLGRRVITRSTAFGLPWFHQCGFAFCFLDPLCASLLRFRACPVKAIGLPFHLRDGDDGIRTHDPLLAGQVLSQLSYTPRCLPGFGTLKIEQRNPFPLRLNSSVFLSFVPLVR